jgi:glycosyltransferase involved in cell wall biosynthesis
MKHVCFFAGNVDLGGGTERSLTLIANEMAGRGYCVTIINLWGGSSPFFPLSASVKIASLFREKISFAKNFIKVLVLLRAYVKEASVDVLVSVESSQSLYALPACVGLPVCHVNWEHFNSKVDLGFFPRRVARYMAAKFSDHIVVLTERDRVLWRQNIGVRRKISTIPNAIPFSISEHTGERENIVLAVGRFTYQKGFDLLLESWKLAVNQLDGWQLWIVGDGEDRNKLQSMVEQYHLQHSVIIHPPTSTISDYYRRAKWFCLSSRFEGLPMVLLEAASWSLPTVAFDCDTGPAEIISHGENGLLCPSGNTIALSGMIVEACSVSVDTYKNMQTKARAIADRFTLPHIGDMWVKLLEEN